jgi:WD40 repeat protein/serine/threonine protein kinase
VNDEPQPPPLVPLKVAQRINQKCEHFEAAWSRLPYPHIEAFMTGVLEPERSWLLVALVALEVELRRGAGEQPTAADYRQSFPAEGDCDVIDAAFRLCAESASELQPSRPAADGSTQGTRAAGPNHVAWATQVQTGQSVGDSSARAPSQSIITGYEILEVLGRGGMGIVYKARDLRLKRLVALKMILAVDHVGPNHFARFRAEAEIVARLAHPNIVQIFDIGEQHGHPYIAFELIEGKTLADFAGREPQPARLAAELLEAMARAIHYAHQQGIVHRDLKPSNVLLTNKAPSASSESSSRSSGSPSSSSALSSDMSGQQATSTELVPKIMDFGLAKDLAAQVAHTSTGDILGTPLYMSPEQAEGRRDIGPASDIYSLGAILYALLAGRPPLQGTTPLETLKMVVSTEPVSPSQLQPRLARDLVTICLKCLHKDAARRYETAGALADDLRRFLHDEPILARPSGRIEKTWRLCRRNPSIAGLLASVLLVLVAGTAVSSYFAYLATQRATESSRLAKVALKAEKHARDDRDRAEASAERARERAYLSDVRLLPRALENSLWILFCELLDGQRPARTDNVDVRGFEWHYWRRVAKAFGIFGRHNSSVRSVCFSPNGTRLAGAGDDGTIKVWAVDTAQEKLTLKGHTSRVCSVCWSPDGKRIASGSLDTTAKVWNAETGQEKLTLKGHARAVQGVCFSPDGMLIASASNDNSLKLWDAATGQEHLTFKGHTEAVQGVCWSPDGKRIASGSGDKTVKVWDALTGQEKLSFQGHTSSVFSVCFSPDGKQIASGSDDRTAKVWDALTGQEKLSFKGHKTAVYTVCWSPDGKRVVSGSLDNAMVKVWDAETGQEALTLTGHSKSVYSVCFSPDGTLIASSGGDRTVRVWDGLVASKALAFEGHQSQVTHFACSPNGRWLASAGGVWEYPARYSAGELRLWDLHTGALLHRLAGHSSGVTCVGFSPDGRYLASGSGVWDTVSKRYTGGEIRLWDPATGAPLGSFEGHDSSVLCLAFSPDSRFLASGGLTGGVLVRRLPGTPFSPSQGATLTVKGQDTFELPGLSNAVNALDFSPDGRFLAGCGFDRILKVWHLAQRSDVAVANLQAPLPCLAYSPDGKQLAVARLEDVLVLDTTTFTEVGRLQGHLDQVNHVTYSPDGKRIATAGEDRTVRLWDSKSGQEMLTLKGHTNLVRCVKFSPDGHRLFSGGWDRIIRTWDATPLD